MCAISRSSRMISSSPAIWVQISPHAKPLTRSCRPMSRARSATNSVGPIEPPVEIIGQLLLEVLEFWLQIFSQPGHDDVGGRARGKEVRPEVALSAALIVVADSVKA